MAERNVCRDEQLQDYIDGRLNERDRAAVAAYLLAHPRVASEVEAIRRQSEALRALGQEILDEPVPEPLRRLLREHAGTARGEPKPKARRATRRPIGGLPSFLQTAAAILLFCAGGAMGWFTHGVVHPAANLDDIFLADDMFLAGMGRAYAFYGARDYPVAFPPDRAEEFGAWIGRSFEREVRPPDLAQFGYRYRGGRLIPSASANIGLFQYERPQDVRLAVFFWTAAAPPVAVHARLDRDDVAARFWNTNGLSFAVISDKANHDLESAAKAIFAFYDQSFRPH
jgi:anti-sigma factor RsiW